LAVAGLLGIAWFLRTRNERRAFLSSCAYLLGMLTSVAFSLYPRLLPATTDPAFTLTIENAKAPEHGLRVGIAWWLLGMILALAYLVYSYRSFSGKVKLPEAGESY
jgi:cytochrome d ubiquinol oxidase subunit II